MNLLWPTIGTIFIGFRLWITHIYLKKDLQEERYFTSRIIVLYAAMAMILNFKVEFLNVIIATAYPMMIFCFFYWDIPFIYSIFMEKSVLPIRTQISTFMHKFWLILERITVHLPLVIMGTPWYYKGLKGIVFPYITMGNYITAIILVLIPFLLVDPRITAKKSWPEGLWLSVIFFLTALGFYLHFFVIFM